MSWLNANCLIEHPVHVRDIACVPVSDILVEAKCIIEHPAHVRDIACVPVSDILIEKLCALLNILFMFVTLLVSQFPMS